MSGFTRRGFLKTGAAALAVSSLASPRAHGANERIRVAILGCRNRGHQVADSMIGEGGFEIAALCDCDKKMSHTADRILKRKVDYELPQVQDFRRVLDDDSVDAVVVATPDHWHGAMTVMALDAGKHVYCEKPASYNIADGDAMLKKAAEYPNLVTITGTQQRSGQHFKDALQFIQEGGIGTPGFARAWITHTRGPVPKVDDTDPPASLDYDLWVGPAPWRDFNPEMTHYNWHWDKSFGTGEMGNWGAHWIDIARWYLGVDLPVAVSGHGGQFVTKDAKQTPDTQTVIYEFPEVTLLWEMRLWTEFKTNRQSSGVEVGGDGGTITITRGGWEFHPADGSPQRHDGSDLMGPHVASFANAIRGTGEVGASLEDGVTSAALCHLGNIVVDSNSRVELDGGALKFVDNPEANAMRYRDWRAPWGEHQPAFEI